MRPRVLGLLLIPILMMAATGLGQGTVEIWIYANHEDDTVSDVLKETAIDDLVKVEVDEELRDKKITVKLEHQVEGALEAIAAAAGGHLWILEAGSYRISTKPQPESGDSEGKGKKGKDPAWKKEILARIEKTEVDVDFEGTPLPKILEKWAAAAKVQIHLDPHVATTWTKEQLAVHVMIIPKRQGLSMALTAVLAFTKLTQDYRWGVMFISTEKRLNALPVDAVPSGDPDLAKKLRETKVDLKLKKSTVQKAVDRIAKLGKVEIGYDAKILRKLPRLTIDLKDTSLADLFALVLTPRDLLLVVEEGKLSITAREKKK